MGSVLILIGLFMFVFFSAKSMVGLVVMFSVSLSDRDDIKATGSSVSMLSILGISIGAVLIAAGNMIGN